MIHNYFLSPNLSDIKVSAFASSSNVSLFNKSATEHEDAFTTFISWTFLDASSKFLSTSDTTIVILLPLKLLDPKNETKSFVLFSSILLVKPSNLFASLNSVRLGQKAPDFLLNGFNKNNPNQKEWSLDDFSGEWLILYFYPKDFSSGCTLQAKAFQDNLSKFKKLNSSVVGISADNEEEHESFCTSAKLGYTLLSDTTGEISKSYDSWLDPYSKRNTFMINPKGIVVYKWIGVRPIGHAQEVLEELIKQKKIYAWTFLRNMVYPHCNSIWVGDCNNNNWLYFINIQ